MSISSSAASSGPQDSRSAETYTGDVAVTGTARVKRGMADMLKGGVIMDVVTPEQAKIAEDAGAVAVMALERVPADIRAQGGVARMSDPDMIDQIIGAVSVPAGLAELDAVLRDTVDLIRIGRVELRPW